MTRDPNAMRDGAWWGGAMPIPHRAEARGAGDRAVPAVPPAGERREVAGGTEKPARRALIEHAEPTGC